MLTHNLDKCWLGTILDFGFSSQHRWLVSINLKTWTLTEAAPAIPLSSRQGPQGGIWATTGTSCRPIVWTICIPFSASSGFLVTGFVFSLFSALGGGERCYEPLFSVSCQLGALCPSKAESPDAVGIICRPASSLTIVLANRLPERPVRIWPRIFLMTLA